MSAQFLTKDNFAKIYSNIKDIIVSNEGFDIDNDKKYKKALKKMAISFHEKNPNQSDISTMNNDALNKFIPFIQSIVSKSGKQGGNIMPFDLSSDSMGSGMSGGMDSGMGLSASNLDDSFNQTLSSQQSDSDASAPNNEDFMQRLNRMENERNNVLQKDFGVDRRNNLAVAQPMSSRQISHQQNDTRTIRNIEEQRKLTDNRIMSQNIHQDSNITTNNNNQLQQQQMMQQMQEKQQRQQMEELQKQRQELTKDKHQQDLSNSNMTKQIEDLQRQLNQLPSTLSTLSNNSNNSNNTNTNIESYAPINIIFDTGTSSNPKVNNGNKKYWINFVVPFQNPIEIKGNRTLYLDNLIIYGIDSSQNVPYFFIEIEEFKADTVTNTFKPAKGISVFNNSTNNTLVSCNQNRKIINVSNLTLNQLTVNVHTNIEDKESIFETSNMVNRIIMEFKVI